MQKETSRKKTKVYRQGKIVIEKKNGGYYLKGKRISSLYNNRKDKEFTLGFNNKKSVIIKNPNASMIRFGNDLHKDILNFLKKCDLAQESLNSLIKKFQKEFGLSRKKAIDSVQRIIGGVLNEIKEKE